MVRITLCVLALSMALPADPIAQNPSGFPVSSGIVEPGAVVELVKDGFTYTEGPVGTDDGGLFFTDTRVEPPRIYRLEPDGRIWLFRDKSNRANGLALDRQGELLAAESDGRRIVRIPRTAAASESVSIAAETIAGAAFIRPNDLIADEHGGVYFTDFMPARGAALPGEKAFVYYVPPNAHHAVVVASDIARPNGLCLTGDGRTLIVDGLGATLYAIDVNPDGTWTNKRPFATLRDMPSDRSAASDGMTIDRTNRVYVATVSGIQVFAGKGEYVGTIPMPRGASNVAFSGRDKRTLYITAGDSLYRLRMVAQGVPRPGK
jgi:gluconolactonase